MGEEVPLRIKIKDFQSIGSANVEANGFTVITGRSNIGKTALIRALTAAFFGKAGDHFVRRGRPFCAVVVEHPDFKLIWRKVVKATPTLFNALQINDTVHTKLGREHSLLTEPLGLRELDTSSTRLRPQIALQHDPIFLLAETEATAAEVFKLLGRVDVITTAQAMATKDRKETEGQVVIRRRDLEEAKKTLADFEDTTLLRDRVRELRRRFQILEEENRKRLTLLKLIDERLAIREPTLPSQMDPAPELKGLPILDLIRQGMAIRSDEMLAESQEREAEREITLREREKTELEQELGSCPTCERPFDRP